MRVPGALLSAGNKCILMSVTVLCADYGEVEMPWWTYGARGMQLWFPSSLAEPLSPTTRETMGFGSGTDPELEFDREVYPIGISLAEIAIIGASIMTSARVLWPQMRLSYLILTADCGAGSFPQRTAAFHQAELELLIAVTPEMFQCQWMCRGTSTCRHPPCALMLARKLSMTGPARYGCIIEACDVGLAGVTQRAVRSGVAAAGRGGGQGGPSHGAYPCFHAVPESQPVLPCLLRRLLQKSKTEVRPS